MISESLKTMYQVIYYHQKNYGSKYPKNISRDFETLLSVIHRSSLVKALLSEYNSLNSFFPDCVDHVHAHLTLVPTSVDASTNCVKNIPVFLCRLGSHLLIVCQSLVSVVVPNGQELRVARQVVSV